MVSRKRVGPEDYPSIAIPDKSGALRYVPNLAQEIGEKIHLAVLQVAYLCNEARLDMRKNNFQDGHWWTYQSVRDLKRKWFKAWGTSTVYRIFNKAVEEEYLIAHNYNSHGYDRTIWWRPNWEKLSLLKSINIDDSHYFPTFSQDRLESMRHGVTETHTIRYALLQRGDDLCCHYCDEEFECLSDATIDHKIPQSKGGSDYLENLVLACVKCNADKGTMDYDDFCCSKMEQQKSNTDSFSCSKMEQLFPKWNNDTIDSHRLHEQTNKGDNTISGNSFQHIQEPDTESLSEQNIASAEDEFDPVWESLGRRRPLPSAVRVPVDEDGTPVPPQYSPDDPLLDYVLSRLRGGRKTLQGKNRRRWENMLARIGEDSRFEDWMRWQVDNKNSAGKPFREFYGNVMSEKANCTFEDWLAGDMIAQDELERLREDRQVKKASSQSKRQSDDRDWSLEAIAKEVAANLNK